MSRPDWDEWLLSVAQAVSTRADCTRRQVGAVIVDAQHRPLSFGYNGLPSGVPGCLTAAGCPRGRMSKDELPSDSAYVGIDVDPKSVCSAIHAEENALLYCDVRARHGAVMYSTQPPCPNCERLIRGSGLARVVWPGGSLDLV